MEKNQTNIQSSPGAVPAAAPAVKKVAIVGCSDTKGLAPYDDKSWEIWAMNNAFHTTRQDAWFEIHPIKCEDGKFFRRKLIKPGVFEWSPEFRGQPMKDYMAYLAKLDCPVYMQQHWDAIPKSEPYPIDDIVRRFGNYFTNSVSYMIALAIVQGATDIGCYGVDMATGTEYGPQRPSCEWMLGIAAGLGVKLTIPAESDLLKTNFLYGFQEREQYEWEKKLALMVSAMEERKKKAMAKHAAAEQQIQQYIGALEAVREVGRIRANLATPKTWKDPV